MPRSGHGPWPQSVLNADDASDLVPALDFARITAQTVPAAACGGVVFLIDECLSPILRLVAAEFGYTSHFVHDFGWRTLKDGQLRPRILEKNLTLVTNNRDDWRSIMADETVHPGLIIIIENVPRPQEILHFVRVLVAIATIPDLVNAVVEVNSDGAVKAYALPS